MTKPWEETWTHDGYCGVRLDGAEIGLFHREWVHYEDSEDIIPDDDRAKLAAQAPAMARLLLDFRTRIPPPMDQVEAVLRAAGVML